MSNNKQSVELTDITAPLLPATQGLIMEDHVSIGILLECAKRGETRGKQPSPSICKVSRILRDVSVRSFIPQLVSIGPIHRENKKLKEFEWMKECYLDDLLNRCHSDPKKTLEACLQMVKKKIPQIRESYAGVKKHYSDSELARMMVMDGCFILEFCFKHENEKNLHLPNKMQNVRIAMDLMLLENQVPFFLLQALFDCSMGEFTLSQVLDKYFAPYFQLFRYDRLREKNSILSNILDKYLAPYIKLFRSPLPEKNRTTDVESDLPEKISTPNVDSNSTHDHVLGYLHKRYQLVDEEQAAESSNPIHTEASKLAYNSIVDLDRSGINFKPHQEDNLSMTIKFQPPLFRSPWSSATLLMPTLVIDDTTELILRNFIAYEQSFPQDRYYFTSYAHAMDTLIDTQEDIAKLVESEVLVNRLGSNQEATDMINKICKNTVVTDFCYTEEFKQMEMHYNGYGDKEFALMRRIIRVYRNDPWKFTALYSAIILFCLTVVQTVYTIRAA